MHRFRWALLVCLCCVAPFAAAQQRTVLTGHVPQWASPEADAGAVPPSVPLTLRLYLKRPAAKQALLDTLMRDQLDPASPDFHHWISPEEFGERFGPSGADLERVTGWLRSRGFAVKQVAHSGLFVQFSGSAEQAEDAFATELHYFRMEGKAPRIAPLEEPSIPAELTDIISAVAGLTEHHAEPGVRGGAKAKPAYSACYGGSCYHFIAPADFATIYDATSVYAGGNKGAGQTVAIVGRARVYSDDISEYESSTDLPAVTPNVIIPPDGIDPGPPNDSTSQAPNGDQGEATLDVTRVIGTAPAATVDLVVSASTQSEDGLDIALEYAVDGQSTLKERVISNSFGLCEAYVTKADAQSIDSLYQQASAEGISVIGISGDSGAAGCDPYNSTPPATQQLSANYLCASGYVTCMGGTEFNDAANPAQYWDANNAPGLGSALSYIPEGAWNEPETDGDFYAQATGGGVSVYLPTPYWQTGPGVPGSVGRYTPDAAFSSADHDGYYACYAAGGGDCNAGYFEYFYGTSAAAPSMAGVVALLDASQGAALGNLNPGLYSIGNQSTLGVFHDTTVASSGVAGCSVATPSMCNNSTPSEVSLTGGRTGYSVTNGFDLATGWGSLDIAKLLKSWTAGQPSVSKVSLTIAPGAAFDAGTTATLTVAASSSSGAAALAGSVTFTANGVPFAQAPVSGGTAKISANTAGLQIGTYSVMALYSGSALLRPSKSTAAAVTLRGPTSSTIAASSTSISSGQSVTLTASVTSAYGSPSGSVQFYTGTLLIGSAKIVAGKASLTASTKGVPAGRYAVYAKYPVSGLFDTSQSSPVTITVQ